MAVYIMAVVVAIDAPNAEAAFSAINNPDDPNGVDGEVVYSTNPFVGDRRMADDPDFHVPSIEYGGAPLPLADEEE